jgi:hypothetical protein
MARLKNPMRKSLIDAEIEKVFHLSRGGSTPPDPV